MRRVLVIFLIATAVAAVAEDNLRSARATSGTQIQQETCSIYKFVPKAEPPVEPQPSWSSGLRPVGVEPPSTDTLNIVMMPPYKVTGSFNGEELHAIFRRQQAEADATEVMGKLGIGVHEADVGKVRFGAVTIFFIPVAFGFSW